MDFAYSTEQVAWRDTVRQFLQRHAPVSASRAGYDPGTWKRMGGLGLHGIHVPEDLGGQGLGGEELAIVVEELGAVLYNGPYFASTVLAATALAAVRDTTLLPAVASGATVATVALWPGPPVAIDGGRLTGEVGAVPFGVEADVVLVDCRRADGTPVLAAVEGAPWRGIESLDLTSRFARTAFTGEPARVLAEGGPARAALGRARDWATALLAVEMIGGARECLAGAVRYARERVQFGRPIGGFQAIKHLCAEMLVELELARSAALYAVLALDGPDATRAASLAKALAGEAYVFIADAALHVHGGMGFTWEHDSHLYLRRAYSASALLGDPATQRERFLNESGYVRELAHTGYAREGES